MNIFVYTYFYFVYETSKDIVLLDSILIDKVCVCTNREPCGPDLQKKKSRAFFSPSPSLAKITESRTTFYKA